jgi:hypothetical protein
MRVWLGCSIAVAIAVLAPAGARADCAQEISQLMSKDTEKLTTRFNKLAKAIESKVVSPRLRAEECRVARALQPRLESQLAALKQSGCMKDPEMGGMVADIVRGHEDDLAMARQSSTRSECR